MLGQGAQDALLQQIEFLAGPGARETADTIIESAEDQPSLGSMAGIAGILVSIVGATTVFAQLQSSLNTIWGIEAKPGNAIWAWIRRRVLSIGILAAIGFVVIVSLLMSAIIGAFLTQTGPIWDVLNQLMTAIVFALLFTLLFRYLPDARLQWRRAVRGGIMTALLFTVGKSIIGLYLSNGDVGGAYGAAGSVVILMVWVYYSSAIFFFGAEFVQAWVTACGELIPPARYAESHEPS